MVDGNSTGEVNGKYVDAWEEKTCELNGRVGSFVQGEIVNKD